MLQQVEIGKTLARRWISSRLFVHGCLEYWLLHKVLGGRNRIKAKKTVCYGTSQIVQWTIHHSSNRNPKESRFSYLERSCLGFGLVAFLVLGSLQIDT